MSAGSILAGCVTVLQLSPPLSISLFSAFQWSLDMPRINRATAESDKGLTQPPPVPQHSDSGVTLETPARVSSLLNTGKSRMDPSWHLHRCTIPHYPSRVLTSRRKCSGKFGHTRSVHHIYIHISRAHSVFLLPQSPQTVRWRPYGDIQNPILFTAITTGYHFATSHLNWASWHPCQVNIPSSEPSPSSATPNACAYGTVMRCNSRFLPGEC